MKLGEQVEISDGTGKQYLCEVGSLEKELIILHVLDVAAEEKELSSKLYLFQGIPKSDKMEWVVQKAVELGVYEIVPVETKRTVVKLDAKKAEKKIARWNAIAGSGAKQSGRGIIPEVKPVMTFSEALSYAQKLDICLIPYEKAEGMEHTRELIQSIRKGQSVGIFIGPEGGFEEAEISRADEAGVFPVTLGKRILRTETAGLAVLSILMYHLE